MRIRLADYRNPADLEAVIAVTDAYAQDPMGGGRPLPEDVKDRLRRDLPAWPGAFSLLAESDTGEALGVANCFTGYGTFSGRPLVNIHDLAVVPEARGRGVGAALLAGVEAEARARGCGKITLEVRDDNPADRLYRRSGFTDGDCPMRFLTKPL